MLFRGRVVAGFELCSPAHPNPSLPVDDERTVCIRHAPFMVHRVWTRCMKCDEGAGAGGGGGAYRVQKHATCKRKHAALCTPAVNDRG